MSILTTLYDATFSLDLGRYYQKLNISKQLKKNYIRPAKTSKNTYFDTALKNPRWSRNKHGQYNLHIVDEYNVLSCRFLVPIPRINYYLLWNGVIKGGSASKQNLSGEVLDLRNWIRSFRNLVFYRPVFELNKQIMLLGNLLRDVFSLG